VTVTFTPAAPHGLVGIGLPYTVSSTFIGPLPTGTRYDITVYRDSSQALPIFSDSLTVTVVTPISFLIGVTPVTSFGYPQAALSSGDSCFVNVILRAGFSTLDSGSATCTWSSVDGLAYKAWIDMNLLWSRIGSSSDLSAIAAAVRHTYHSTP
jgi:hypothetical protein